MVRIVIVTGRLLTTINIFKSSIVYVDSKSWTLADFHAARKSYVGDSGNVRGKKILMTRVLHLKLAKYILVGITCGNIYKAFKKTSER